MNKRKIAILLELVPIISSVLSFILIKLDNNPKIIIWIIAITILLSFFGFVFFFIGRKLAKENKIVRILGIFDWIATLYVIFLYTIAISVFGL